MIQTEKKNTTHLPKLKLETLQVPETEVPKPNLETSEPPKFPETPMLPETHEPHTEIKEQQTKKGIKKEKEELIAIPSTSKQIILRKLAYFCTSNKGNDLYAFYEATRYLTAAMGDQAQQILKQIYPGEEHAIVEQKLDLLGRLLNTQKMYYDSLETGTIDKEDITNKKFMEYKKVINKIPAIQKLLFKTFHKLLEKTNLKYASIPAEYFRKEEMYHKKFTYRPEPRREIVEEEHHVD